MAQPAPKLAAKEYGKSGRPHVASMITNSKQEKSMSNPIYLMPPSPNPNLTKPAHYPKQIIPVKGAKKPENNSRIEKAINWIRIHVFGQKQDYTMILHVTDTTKLPDSGLISKKDLGKDVRIEEDVAVRLRQDLKADENVEIKYEYEDAPAQHDAYDVDSDFELAIAISRSIETEKADQRAKFENEFDFLRDIVRNLDESLSIKTSDDEDLSTTSKVEALRDFALFYCNQGKFEEAQTQFDDAELLVKNYEEKIASYEDKTASDQKKAKTNLIDQKEFAQAKGPPQKTKGAVNDKLKQQGTKENTSDHLPTSTTIIHDDVLEAIQNEIPHNVNIIENSAVNNIEDDDDDDEFEQFFDEAIEELEKNNVFTHDDTSDEEVDIGLNSIGKPDKKYITGHLHENTTVIKDDPKYLLDDEYKMLSDDEKAAINFFAAMSDNAN
jgi:hypothetical protein